MRGERTPTLGLVWACPAPPPFQASCSSASTRRGTRCTSSCGCRASPSPPASTARLPHPLSPTLHPPSHALSLTTPLASPPCPGTSPPATQPRPPPTHTPRPRPGEHRWLLALPSALPAHGLPLYPQYALSLALAERLSASPDAGGAISRNLPASLHHSTDLTVRPRPPRARHDPSPQKAAAGVTSARGAHSTRLSAPGGGGGEGGGEGG